MASKLRITVIILYLEIERNIGIKLYEILVFDCPNFLYELQASHYETNGLDVVFSF